MSRPKQPKTTETPQPDPWLAWCSPAQGQRVKDLIFNYSLELNYPDWPLDEIEFDSHNISNAARDIVPEVPDVKKHPVPKLEFMPAGYSVSVISKCEMIPQQFTTDEMSEKVFDTLDIIRGVWPHPQAVKHLKCLAPKVAHLLMATHELLGKKIALANVMGLKGAAAKLETACKNSCMIDLTSDIAKDAEQLFLVKKITPDTFRAAMRSAFKLDREATDEINGVGNAMSAPTQQQVSTDGYTEADRKRDDETHALVLKLKSKQAERQYAANLINEIYHDEAKELAKYAKSKGKKRASRPLAISYIQHDIPKKSKFYERAVAVRNSVLRLAKSSSPKDKEAVWNSILTMAKKTDPEKGRQKHTDEYLKEQDEYRYGNDSRRPRIVPNIGDASSNW